MFLTESKRSCFTSVKTIGNVNLCVLIFVFCQVGCTVTFFVKGISLGAMLYMHTGCWLCRCAGVQVCKQQHVPTYYLIRVLELTG